MACNIVSLVLRSVVVLMSCAGMVQNYCVTNVTHNVELLLSRYHVRIVYHLIFHPVQSVVSYKLDLNEFDNMIFLDDIFFVLIS